EVLRAVGLGVTGGPDEVEIGRGDEEILGRLRVERVEDEPVGLLAEGQTVLRLRRPGLALRVVEGPLVEGDDPLPRRVDELLAELDRLGEDDLLLGLSPEGPTGRGSRG